MMYKITIIFFCTILLVVACKDEYYETEDCYDYDYSDCNTIKPETGKIRIDLTINKANPEVEVIVFKGYPEDKDTLTTAKINTPVFEVSVGLNHRYSAQVKYSVNGKTVYVSDGNTISSYSNVRCDSTCWSIKGGYIDARLKYDNI